MEDKPKPKRKLQSGNLLRKKVKKPGIEDMPELIEFKKKADKGALSKEETVDYLRNLMDKMKKENIRSNS